MLWSILHRYVLWEVLRVFAMSLTTITSILVMAGVVAEAAQQGVGPDQILKLIPLLIPGTLPYTVPATILFAVSVIYGRMSADNEITAIKSAGIPVTHVVWPAVIIGLALSGAIFGLYQDFIPRMHHRLRTTAMKDIEALLYSRLRRDLCFTEPRVSYAIWVKEVQGHRLIRPTFKKRDEQGKDEIIAQASVAELWVDLPNETIYVEMWNGEMSKDGGATYFIFDREKIPLPLPPIGAARQMRAREMTNRQILARRSELIIECEALEARIAELAQEEEAKKSAAKGPASRVKREKKPEEKPRPDEKPESKPREKKLANRPSASARNESSSPGMAEGTESSGDKKAATPQLPLPTQLQYLRREIWELDTEYAVRPALSLGCLCFVLIGCPVAIWFHKRDYLSAFVTCFLPIVVVYYPLMMFGINLGKEGRLDPTYFMWTGNAVLGLVAVLLMWRLVRR